MGLYGNNPFCYLRIKKLKIAGSTGYTSHRAPCAVFVWPVLIPGPIAIASKIRTSCRTWDRWEDSTGLQIKFGQPGYRASLVRRYSNPALLKHWKDLPPSWISRKAGPKANKPASLQAWQVTIDGIGIYKKG